MCKYALVDNKKIVLNCITVDLATVAIEQSKHFFIFYCHITI